MKLCKVIQNQLKGSTGQGKLIQAASATSAEILPASTATTGDKLATPAEHSLGEQSSQSTTWRTSASRIEHAK